MLKDPNVRNPVMYLLGTLVLITVLFLFLTRFSETGFSGSTGAGKSYKEVPSKIIEDGKDYQAIIKTNKGDIKIDLFEKNAPNTVNDFVFLSQDGFYNEVKFHRIVKDFIIQSGSRLTLDKDPRNDGLGGPGYRFADEINWASLGLTEEQKKILSDQGFKGDAEVSSVIMEKYSFAMANAGPNTNGSQFFITTADKDNESIKALNGKHTVFGKVIEGFDIVDSINNAELKTEAGLEAPKEDIIIKSIEIIK